MNDKVECPMCGNKFKVVSATHIRCKHGISMEEFKKLYPDVKLCSEEFRHRMSEVNKENMSNPESVKKISESVKNFYKTDYGKKIRSEQMKKVWSDDDYKKARINHVVERRYETGGNIRQSEKMKKFWEDSTNRELLVYYQREAQKRDDVKLSKKIAGVKNWQDPNYRRKVISNYKKSDYICKDGRVISCKSSYEEKCLRFIEELDYNFLWEELSFTYIKSEDGLVHNYIPDVYLTDKDVYLEIKPVGLILDQENVDKRRCMIDNNRYITYITEEELESIDSFQRAVDDLVDKRDNNVRQDII